ncbi:MAG: site-specific DNA-methyltransferase [Burkholderiales bacterium]|nr:site-specific DNA-methyltransferase [Burkholderiales bacterium]
MKKLTAVDPETKSPDLVAENLERLKALFPELVTEGAGGVAVNVDVLKQLVGDKTVADADEKYGLNWHGKRRARQLALTPSTGTLRPCPEDSVNWDTTQNLMIEGDNLEVLKLLQKSYAGKVKLIYIDPPYNTGKDFVYPDDFKDNIKNYLELTGQVEGGRKISSNTEASGRFHTDWLTMMLPRLKVARGMLTRDGVVVISIDDMELANLRLICDEVFGSENFVATLTWEKSRKNDAKLVSAGHDYVVIYASSLGYLKEKQIKWREEKPGAREIWEQYIKLRGVHGENNTAVESALQTWFSDLPKSHPAKKWSRYRRVDKNGPWRDYDISWPGGNGPRYDVIHPVTHKPCAVPERGWVFANPETMSEMIALGVVAFRVDHSEPPIRKLHLRPLDFELASSELNDDQADDSDALNEEELATQVRGTYFYKQTQVTAKYMRSLMGARVFDNPKDHVEIARLVDYASAGDSAAIVMDFFAGSGTTGHAVWSLNATNPGARRYLLVQLPEPLDPENKDQKVAADFCNRLDKPRNIAELTKERLRRAAKKIKDENPMFAGDLGFRVFKLDSSNIRAWEPDRDDLDRTLLDHQEHLKEGRSEQDILYELLLKLGLDLCVPIETQTIAGKAVHSIGGGVLLACLATQIARDEVEPLAQGIVAWHQALAPAGPQGKESTCVFRDSAFADDVAKTNLAAILNQHGLTSVRSL